MHALYCCSPLCMPSVDECIRPLCVQVIVCSVREAGGYSYSADVWAAGCIIYSLVTDQLRCDGPFGDSHQDDDVMPRALTLTHTLLCIHAHRTEYNCTPYASRYTASPARRESQSSLDLT